MSSGPSMGTTALTRSPIASRPRRASPGSRTSRTRGTSSTPSPLRWVQWLSTVRRLRNASALTETCAAQGDSDAARFGLPYHLLWSGYDEGLMAVAEPARGSEGFSLAYVGNIGPQHDIAAIGRPFRAYEALHDRLFPLELHTFSNDTTALREQPHALGLAQHLTVHAFVPRAKAYGIMKGADALLLPHTDARGAFGRIDRCEGVRVLRLGHAGALARPPPSPSSRRWRGAVL